MMTVPPKRGPGRLDHDRRHRRAGSPSQGTGPRPTDARIVLNAPVGLALVEDLPQQHRNDRGNDYGQIGEGAVEALEAARLAHDHRQDQRDRIADDERQEGEIGGVGYGLAEQRVGQDVGEVVQADEGRCGTRFVCWTPITNERRIGNQEKTPKTTSSGSRKTNLLSPSRLIQVRGLRTLSSRLASLSFRPRSS